MQVNNRLLPNRQQIEGFSAPDDGAAIYMVNLLKYREHAAYEDGRNSDLSGREAYEIYGDGVPACIEKVGGKIVFAGTVRRLMLGEVEDLWDDIAIAMYPSRKAMLDMMMLPEYEEITVHRNAGLEGQLNIETVGGMLV